MEPVINKPVISTIIPVYNGEKYVAEAIESALNQTYPEQEIILVDDGSTDSTARVIREFLPRVKYCFQCNAGTASARNLGVSVATGEYFAFLDHDDFWEKGKLAHQLAAFHSEPGLNIVFGHLQQFRSPELENDLKGKPCLAPKSTPGVLPSSMMVTRDAFFQVGLFDTTWQLAEWADWYCRAVECGLNIEVLPEVLTFRRLHHDNKGIVQRQHMQDYPRALKALLDRRRANTS